MEAVKDSKDLFKEFIRAHMRVLFDTSLDACGLLQLQVEEKKTLDVLSDSVLQARNSGSKIGEFVMTAHPEIMSADVTERLKNLKEQNLPVVEKVRRVKTIMYTAMYIVSPDTASSFFESYFQKLVDKRIA